MLFTEFRVFIFDIIFVFLLKQRRNSGKFVGGLSGLGENLREHAKVVPNGQDFGALDIRGVRIAHFFHDDVRDEQRIVRLPWLEKTGTYCNCRG